MYKGFLQVNNKTQSNLAERWYHTDIKQALEEHCMVMGMFIS